MQSSCRSWVGRHINQVYKLSIIHLVPLTISEPLWRTKMGVSDLVFDPSRLGQRRHLARRQRATASAVP